jgi:CheY-like chemotaxis protein
MSDSVMIALIGAAVVLIIFVTSVVLFRNRITSIEASKEGIKITLAEREAAQDSLTKAEQSRMHEEASDPTKLVQTRQKIAEIEHKLRKTVLWVDDHPSNNTYEVEALQPLGVEIRQAESNTEAYSEIEKQRPDLVITDISRDNQQTDGLDLVSTLSEQRPGLPVIVYTSYGGARSKKTEALARGARAITGHPAELIQLVLDYLK